MRPRGLCSAVALAVATILAGTSPVFAQAQEDKPLVARHGDFAYLPSHHVHRATCLGAAPCLVFLSADAPFDIHWVDEAGQEIPLAAALPGAKRAVAAGRKR